MKKFILGLLVIMAISFYQSQKPIMSTGEAKLKAEEHLQNPSKEWGDSIPKVDVKSLSSEAVETSLRIKRGFYYGLTNQRQWEVTIKYQGMEPTVVMDAYTGELIEIYGPLN